MEISGVDGNLNLSEESKKALQSETWQAVREGMKEKRDVNPEREESEEDNGDAEKDTAVEQEEADTEAGKVPPEERTAEAEKEDSDDEAERSSSLEDMPKDIGRKAADKKGKPAKYSGIDGAVAKLQEELKGAKPKEFAEPVIEYLAERCKESEILAADICQDHKTWKKCYDYIVVNARKKLNNVSGPVRGDIVFEWAEDYYHKDDKAEEEKKAKKEAEDKAKREKAAAERKSAQNTRTGKEGKAPAPKKIETPKEPPKPKRSGKDMEGQMDMFSMMGM